MNAWLEEKNSLNLDQVVVTRIPDAGDGTVLLSSDLPHRGQNQVVAKTLNRGPSYGKSHDPARDPKDRYREMRAIKAAMTQQELAAIPGLIRAMTRIWFGTAIEQDMRRRREDEAALFEAGLAMLPQARYYAPSARGAGLESAASKAPPLPHALSPDAAVGVGDEDFWEQIGEADLTRALRNGVGPLETVGRTARWATDADSPDYAHLGPSQWLAADFLLTADDLTLLAELNDFPLDAAVDTPILFGLRGALILQDHSGSSREMTLTDCRPDHQTPRCVIGVWDRRQGRVFVFPGSTVPNARAVAGYAAGGQSGNLLPTGLYGYIVGPHVTSKSRPGCFLLRKTPTEKRQVVVRRSRDDLVYTSRDIVDPCLPGDNIHPTFFSLPTGFDSFGCQTVVGTTDEAGNHRGPWAEFRMAAGQASPAGEPGKAYLYMLLTGTEARLASGLRRHGLALDPPSREALRRLRFGAAGPAVERLQERLGLARPDGAFGPLTARRLHDLQQSLSPDRRSDGILTPRIDQALGWGVLGHLTS